MSTWFAHEFCRDIGATRRFYGDLVGLACIWEGEGEAAFEHGQVQLSFVQSAHARLIDQWARQPGWGEGQVALETPLAQVRSWSIALSPGQFRGAVQRLMAAEVTALWPEPRWLGYWSFVVRDPDGTTVELSDPTTGHEPG